jgi:hypothetical protein
VAVPAVSSAAVRVVTFFDSDFLELEPFGFLEDDFVPESLSPSFFFADALVEDLPDDFADDLDAEDLEADVFFVAAPSACPSRWDRADVAFRPALPAIVMIAATL